MHGTATPRALTEPVNEATRACHPVSGNFRKPGSRLSATKDAPARSRACLDATPAAKPEIRAFDEAIQSGRQLRIPREAGYDGEVFEVGALG